LNIEPANVRGDLKIYSCPKYLCKPVEWALSEQFKIHINLNWVEQQIAPSTMASQIKWIGPFGLGSRIVSALSKWQKIRLEVFQESFKEYSAERYSLSPNLGIFRTDINSLGETVITESRLKTALWRARLENEPFEIELAFLLGTPWEEDLEPFRRATEGNNLKWIRQTG
jgi:hypothetical protein